MTKAKTGRAKFFALDPILIEDSRIEPGDEFTCDEVLGLHLVGNGSAETPEMNEARADAAAAVKKAQAALKKAKANEAKALRNLADTSDNKDKG